MSQEINAIDPRIVKFIKKHHVLTLATAKDNIPWTAHCFYAFLEGESALVFTTDDTTRHGREMLDNQAVAGGISLETKVVGMIRGVQVTGKVHKCNNDNTPKGPRFRGDDDQLGEHNQSTTERVSSRTERSGDPGPFGELAKNQKNAARSSYLRRFPYATLMKTNLWVLNIETIKFTDNRLGFGKKLFWEQK